MRSTLSVFVVGAAATSLLLTYPQQARAAPNALASPVPDGWVTPPLPILFSKRDGGEHGGHDHHAHGPPKLELNETDILMWHKPTPPSYGIHDFEDPNVTNKYPGLMALHVLLMSSAFFIALPIGIALRSVNHPLHAISVAAFYGLSVLGLSASALYRKLTPNMYEGAKHGPQGYFVLLIAGILTTIDALACIHRFVRYILSIRNGEKAFSFRLLWQEVVLNRSESEDLTPKFAHEYTGLVEEPEEIRMEEAQLKAHDFQGENDSQSPLEDEQHKTARWADDVNDVRHAHHQRNSEWRHSIASDGTLFGTRSPPRRESHLSDETLQDLPASFAPKTPLVKKIGRGMFATTERALVFMGYGQVLTGIVTYTGVCRDSYVNACLAHLIKGGIFWCYGLVTFARFLGSFSELGWAWNRTPRAKDVISAEFVESIVIFVYGITNTWMERFGVPSGTPFSTKEVQHISIAVMFWFAGLVGMGIESRRLRRWLSAPAVALVHSQLATERDIVQPASYKASFNPFPALVIGVTGAAMSAHAQVYLFQVQIHALWGFLLCAFSVLRCLTYFFLWLGPPTSVLPSRPPTEALASFFLACGGLMFQFSTEELTIAAMRRHHDDQMMFLNVAVAVTCLAFCWVLFIVTFKAWLKSRMLVSGSIYRATS